MLRFVSILFFILLHGLLFAQDKTTAAKRIVKQMTLSADYSEEITVPFDTVFSLFHRHRLADRYSPLNATLGNYGLPFYQLNFFDRVTDPDKFLYANYYPFLFQPANAVFMNTQVPFTEMVWTYGAPRETSEQTFRVRHSQNVNRYFNLGLIYDIIYSLGQYNYQRAEDKTFTFFSSYTGPRYKAYLSTGINNIKSYENGGIMDINQLADFETREVPVNLGSLSAAVGLLKNRNIMLVQRYTFGKQAQTTDTVNIKSNSIRGLSGTFSQIFSWESNKRTYSDKYPESDFYDTIFIDNSITFDSLYSGIMKNTLRFDFSTDGERRVSLGGGAGIRNELHNYSQIIPLPDTMAVDTSTWKKVTNAIVGRLYNNVGQRFRWSANGELYFTGYRAGDFSLSGEIRKTFGWEKGTAAWIITGGIINRQPSFWYEQWGSNHYKWSNNINKEFRIDAGTSFIYPARDTELKLNYAIIDNYTGFDENALPFQHSGGLSVVSLMVRKEFTAWKFHFNTETLLQKSSNSEVLDLPLFTTRSAVFIEHLFRFKQTNGKLNTQLGAEVFFHTPYYSFSYMPATGRFYNQSQEKIGNYPFINVFLNIKLKRTRIFLMFDHLNAGLLSYNYLLTPSYPLNARMLRYGLAWTFYN
ncbi:MAG: putative porin [Bacteroidales bacterium]|nr:putative porin [Bacteroidales bacterium]